MNSILVNSLLGVSTIFNVTAPAEVIHNSPYPMSAKYISIEDNVNRDYFMVKDGTSYISVDDIISTLNHLDFSSTWKNNTLNITSPMGVSSSPSNIVTQGPYRVVLDGSVIAKTSGISYLNPHTRKKTVYLPLASLIRTLHSVGYKAIWNGKTLSVSGVSEFSLRKFPFPYQSMLSIAADSDHQTLRKFNLVHEFLNTTDDTPMGHGLGLDIADSFFMYNGSDINESVDVGNLPISDEFTYFKGTSDERYGADAIDHYIQNGWIDSLHSLGDFSMEDQTQTLFTRQMAVNAINALEQNNDRLTVWINHGNKSNVDNFGAYGVDPFYHYQLGGIPTSPYYDADLVIPYGIHFVWTGQTSDVFGRDSMIYPITLMDGQKVWGFWRYTNSSYNKVGAPVWNWTADSLYQQINSYNLNQLVQNQDYAIVAQHFSADNAEVPFSKLDVRALQNLAAMQQSGNILVARTSRLLNYNVVQQYLNYNVYKSNGKNVIDIASVNDPQFGIYVPTASDLYGVTFYTNDPKDTIIEINGVPVDSSLLQVNPSDGNAASIGFKWYAPDTTDYTMQPEGVR